MKTIMMFLTRTRLGVFTLGMALAITAPTVAALSLTGGAEFSTDAAGAASGGQFWNTRGGDIPFNLYLSRTGLNGTLLNPGNGAAVSLDEVLAPGTHTFHLFGEPGIARDHFGLNLFFNGDNANPGISVFAARDTGPSPPYPAFAANTNSATLNVVGDAVGGAGTLVYSDGQFEATLTDYRYSEPAVENLDRISGRDSIPSGAADFIGHFTLQVVPVPLPPALLLLGSALALCSCNRRHGKRRSHTAPGTRPGHGALVTQ